MSGIVDHKGKITETIPEYTQGVVTGEVKVMTGSTPYVKYGNYLVAISTFALLLLSLFLRRRNSR